MAGPLISFLTDFGPESAPAVCRGVMWGIAPDARILDLSHTVRKYAIRDGAFLLSRMVRYLPVGVHVAVVDPGVGTRRRPIALRTRRGDALVGPDNGLLIPAAHVLGGITAAHEITNADLFLTKVSPTFHGRDIFSPVGAHLANGMAIGEVGPEIDQASLVGLTFPEPRVHGRVLETAVLMIDSFGNARLAGQPADLARAAGGELTPGQPFRVAGGAIVGGAEVTWHTTFGEVAAGQPLLFEDADYGGLGISVNQASAAERFGLDIDTALRIEALDT
ncbi:MAG TPA: SAM-dependent chlorinase/fluorinase [Candidatus Limnocylindrales bacterium]|nr:SAM-dependent chlorinase/fluorinase [Candidatus Limnocylindrales bacterium]